MNWIVFVFNDSFAFSKKNVGAQICIGFQEYSAGQFDKACNMKIIDDPLTNVTITCCTEIPFWQNNAKTTAFFSKQLITPFNK